MKILIAGNKEAAGPWDFAFRRLLDTVVYECDPAGGQDNYDAEKTVSAFRETISNIKPDAVCIVTERSCRGPLVVAAVELGIHALVETPIAETAAEYKKATETSDRTGALLMAANPKAFRTGFLSAVSAIYRGSPDALGSINATVYVDPAMSHVLNVFADDHEAFSLLERELSDYLCVSNLLTRSNFDEASITSENTDTKSNISISMKYGGNRVNFDFLRSCEDIAAGEEKSTRKKAGLPENAKIDFDFTAMFGAGELIYFHTTGGEYVCTGRRGKYQTVSFPIENDRHSMAAHFSDFIKQGIKPFVDAGLYAAAGAAALRVINLIKEHEEKKLSEFIEKEELPEFWSWLLRAEPWTGPTYRYIEYEEYVKRMDWTAGGGFRLKLIAAPCNSYEESSKKKFSDYALAVLAGVAGRHGCRVETDDLNALALRPGILEQAEIDAVWSAARPLGVLSKQAAIESAAKKAAKYIAPDNYDLIGFSIHEESHYEFMLALCGEIKRTSVTPIVIGGAVGPMMGRLDKRADFAMQGEGEVPLIALIRHVAGDWPIDMVPGLSYPFSNQLYPSFITDMRIRGLPAYNQELAKLYEKNGVAFYPYAFVNGCPHRCGFCSSYSAGKSRTLDVPEVIDHLESIHDTMGAKYFYFLNNLLNFDRGYLDTLLDGLIEKLPGINWFDSACLYGFDGATLEKMRRAGCRKITWGLDTGSSRLAGIMRKPIRIDAAAPILKLARAAGVHNAVNLIVGLPREERSDLDETFRFVEKNIKYISQVDCCSYIFANASPVYLHPQEFGLIKKGNSFDEEGGLKWADKVEQIKTHYRMTKEFVNSFSDRFIDDYDILT